MTDVTTFTVTAAFITKGQSFRGGWTRRQFEILGVGWPPAPGWRRRALGIEITQLEAAEFLSLKLHRNVEES